MAKNNTGNKDPGSEPSLQKGLGVLDGWAVGTGAMVGVTVFVVSGTISGMAGPSACLGFVIACLLVFAVALCYCEIAAAAPGTGGAYLYPRRVFKGKTGDVLSFLSGWCLWGGQGLAPAVVTVATVGYIISLINLVTGSAIQNTTLITSIVASVLTIVYFISNWFGSSGGRIVQIASTAIVVAVLVIFIVWGGVNMDPELLTPFAPGGVSAILAAAAACILSFSGWSTIPNMSGEFKDPVHDVPKSAILSLATCGILFALFVYVMNGLLPGSVLAESASPPVDAMNTFTAAGAIIIAIGGLCACISTSNGLMMSGSRIPMAMGTDGDLPRVLGTTNKHGVPKGALIITMIGQLALCLSGSAIYTLVSLSVCATIVSWVISVICAIALRKNHYVSPFRIKAFPLVAIIAIAGLVFMFFQLSTKGIIAAIIWAVVGLVVYWLFNKTGLAAKCNEKKPVELLVAQGEGEGAEQAAAGA